MYRHGLGDCFLLSFPRNPASGKADPFTILIDCGIIPGTHAGDAKLKEVIDDIRTTTGGRIDVLVATHEHADHVSGFDPDQKWFEGFEFDHVWLAWTEDPDDKVATSLRANRQQRLKALWLGFHQLGQRLDALGVSGPSREEADQAAKVLSFFGIEPGDAPPTEGPSVASGASGPGRTARAMTWVRSQAKEKPRYWHPGESGALPDVDGVLVYVLGPPKDLAQLHKDLPSGGKGRVVETYEEGSPAVRATPRPAASRSSSTNPGAAERAFFASAAGSQSGHAHGEHAPAALPFDRKYRIEWDLAPRVEFFEDHYFGGDRSQDWRRIDADWADAATSFALQLDGDTNNTSLALAFELPGGHVLLFPGDAQVGNWESWHADSSGRPLVFEDSASGRKKTAESLLNRVVLYKVGHHGSHNATLRDDGLEMMNDPGFSALVPVDSYVAHVKKRWGKMPFEPLMRRLSEKVSGGRIVRADGPLEGTTAIEGLSARFEDSPINFQVRFEVEGSEEPVERPLFVDYILKLESP